VSTPAFPSSAAEAWSELLGDPDLGLIRPLLVAVHADAALRCLYPIVSHLTQVRLLADPEDRSADQIWITLTSAGLYRVWCRRRHILGRPCDSVADAATVARTILSEQRVEETPADNPVDYVPFTYGVSGTSLREANSGDALMAFRNFLTSIDGRLVQLAKVVSWSDIRLDLSVESVDRLEWWYLANIEPEPDDPRQLSLLTGSLATDLGIYLGEVMIHRDPSLAWVMWPDATSPMFQRHVISVSDVELRGDWAVDPCMLFASYGLQHLDGNSPERGFFARVVREITAGATS
jgi:hypothetical protein